MLDIKKDLQNIYDSIAGEFSATRAFPWQELSVFIPYLPQGGKILDLGCGNGRLLKVLQDAGKEFDYLGVDFSQGLLDQAKKQFPDRKFRLVDIAVVDFPPASFDVICVVAAFHHLPTKSERLRVLRKINTWLKPGGVLFMTNWNLLQYKYLKYFLKNLLNKKTWNDCLIPYRLPNSKKVYWRYYHHFTKGELEKLLFLAGFKLEPKGVYYSKYNIDCLVKKA